MKSRIRLCIFALVVAVLAFFNSSAFANTTMSNVVLGGSGCGWLVMAGSNIIPTNSTTVDIIFTINVALRTDKR